MTRAAGPSPGAGDQTPPGSSSHTGACAVCAGEMVLSHRARLLNKFEVQYYACPECGFRRTEEPYWLDEAYGAAISAMDTGLMARNLAVARTLNSLLPVLATHGPFVDWAGGLGVLVRLMRDRGYDYYWSDPFADNEHARGFEWTSTDEQGPATVVTAVEVLEHTSDPLEFFREMVASTGASFIVFSQELFQPGTQPDWWYYAHESGQHISFYEHRTLRRIAAELGMNLLTFGGLFVLARRSLDLPSDSRLAWKWRRVREALGPSVSPKSLMAPDHQRLKRQLRMPGHTPS